MSMFYRNRVEDRLMFLRKILTQPGVDEKIDHYHRQQLTEEVMELEAKTVPVLEEEELERIYY